MAQLDSNESYDQALAQAGLPPLTDPPPAPSAMPLHTEFVNPMASPHEAPADSYHPDQTPPAVPDRSAVRIPVGAGHYGEPDTDQSHAEGFDEVLHGYGAAPTPPMGRAPQSPTGPVTPGPVGDTLPPVGTDDWVAAVRVMSITRPTDLQRYLIEQPELYPAIAAATNPGGEPMISTGLTRADAESAIPSPAEKPQTIKPRASDLDHVAQTGWRGWVARTLNVPVPKGRAELVAEDLEMAADMVRACLDRDQALVIGVSSYKGGCGKTRVSTMLAKEVAEILDQVLAPEGYLWRGRELMGAVCAIDTDWLGMLAACSQDQALMRTDEGANLTTLCARAGEYGVEQIGDLAHYIHTTDDRGYSFIPGNRRNEPTQLNCEGYPLALELLRQKFAVVVVDMAQVGNTAHYGAVLRDLDGLIMVTSPERAEVGFLDNSRQMLSSRPPNGLGADHLIKQRITLINNYKKVRGWRKASHDDVAAKLKLHEASGAETENPRGADVAEVPFDRQINDRALVKIADVARPTRYGVQMAAGALFDATMNLSGRE